MDQRPGIQSYLDFTCHSEVNALHILTLTSLFPNSSQPNKGVFIRSRMENFTRKFGHAWTVVAPVPWFPALPFRVNPKYDLFASIPKVENPWGYPIHHPRYLVTPKIGMRFYGTWMASGIRKVIRDIHERHPIDVLDGHYIFPDGTAATVLGAELGIPVILSARGSDLSQYSQFKHIVPRLRQNLAAASKVICVCTELANKAKALGAPPEKVLVVGNGVDTSIFRRRDQNEARAILGIPSKDRLFLSVGNLTELKGFHLILEAFGRLQEPGLRMAVVGEGPQAPELERLACSPGLRNKVMLPGRVLHRDLPLWYSAADFFVMASSREGWPNVLCEAQAMGLPVLCTRVWGVSEIVTNPSLGILIGERTPDALYDAMMGALRENWNRGHIEAVGRIRTWDKVSEELQEIFQPVAKGGKGP